MKIERLKSILLVLLVISSIVLTINKWFNEKLWPEGYNFFSNVKNHIFSDTKEKSDFDYEITEDILNPSKIILNNSGSHVLHSRNSDKYSSLMEEIKTLLANVAKSDGFDAVDESEWNNILKSKSCYFAYPVSFDADFFFSNFTDEYKLQINAVNEFVVCGDLRIPSVMYIYIKDAVDGVIYKKRVNFESQYILEEIDACYTNSDEITYFSFELNFDTEDEQAVENAIVIDPDVLINISEKKVPVISEANLFDNIAKNSDLYSSVLSLFGYNTSTIRKYIEKDNSIVFVENYGTIKFHTSGMLDYKAIDSTKGVSLSQGSVFDCVNSCIAMVDSVTSLMDFGADMHCKISCDIKDFSSNTFKLVFDYYIDDNMIIVPYEQYNANHAVEVEVSSGKIVSYRQICKSYEIVANEYITCSSAIDAIDKVQGMGNASFVRVSDIFTAYTFDTASKKWVPSWHIEDSNGEISTVVTKREE